MSGPSVLERCRMALAEIGLDPNLVTPLGEAYRIHRSVPLDVRWMLRCTAIGGGSNDRHLCWPCAEQAYMRQYGVAGSPAKQQVLIAARDACRADRPFQRVSCGATQ